MKHVKYFILVNALTFSGIFGNAIHAGDNVLGVLSAVAIWVSAGFYHYD